MVTKTCPSTSSFNVNNSSTLLSGQNVLIVGAAGQLGFEFCKRLGQAGAKVIVADFNEELCEKRLEALKKLKVMARATHLDVTKPKSVNSVFKQIKKIEGNLHILVNAAATAVFTPFEQRTFKDFMKVLGINVGGVFLTCQAAARLMKKQKDGGKIINIASVYGVVSSDPTIYTDCNRRNSEVYSASKAAVIQLTRYLAVHLAPYNIRVNAISPGGVLRNQGPDFIKNYSRRTPLGRMAFEHEISESVLYLASDASSYVTGHNLIIDGGLTAW